MKTYVNKTNKQRAIRFTDGTTRFLKRGMKISTDKSVKKMDSGIVEKEVKTDPKTSSTKTSTKDTTSTKTNTETKQESE